MEPVIAPRSSLDGAARDSQQRWLRERDYLNGHRHELTAMVQGLYPASWQVAGTPMISCPDWLPAGPVPLEAVTLSWDPGRHGTVIDGTRPAGSAGVRPLRDDGARYGSYASALAALKKPRLLENRTCYRLLAVDGRGGRLGFGMGRYFDLINVSEAVAHETAGRVLARRGGPGGPLTMGELPLRSAVDDPLDLGRRPVMTGVATLMLRAGRDGARMFLHWRDPARVAVNGGLYQVAPAGMFQPSHDGEWNLTNDLSLWRAIVREMSEELLGTGEDYGSGQAPIDYPAWPFYAAMDAARQAGRLRAYWLGAGADPLTLDVDLLTVLVVEADFFDREFGGLVGSNDEGHLVAVAGGPAGVEFSAASVERFTTTEAMQPAGAALLRLAWQHREALLGG